MFRRFSAGKSKAAKRAEEIKLLHNSQLVDPVWYRQIYADLRDTPLDVARHYLEYGAAEGRNPGPFFDTTFYLTENPDVAAANMNPLVHYILRGEKDGRHPHPRSVTKRDGLSTPSIDQLVADVDLITRSDLFDATFYLAKNPDVKSTKIDPAYHYIMYGGKEGREPSALFCATRYLKENADVRESGINPLVHWLRHGRSERRPFPFVDTENDLQLSFYCTINDIEDKYTKHFDKAFFISVITPTHNIDPQYLSELLFTLQNQRYSNWEWLVVDDGSINPDTIIQLKLMAKKEPRLRVYFRENGGTSAASNIALSFAQGTHVALVDHDDLLARDAFLLIWQRWKIAPETTLFYTDECKLSENYELYDFYHKPGWSPAYLENTMYYGHLSVYRIDTVRNVGGFRSEFDGTQDFDLALRVSANAIACHIPSVCYFWRAIEGSSAASLGSKEYVLERQRAALLQYANGKNPAAIVRAGWSPGFWCVEYPLSKDAPLVSYIIPTAARSRIIRGVKTDLLEHCIRNIEAAAFYPRYEFIVVHNGDLTQGQRAFLATKNNTLLVEYKPKSTFNFSEKINLGVTHAKGTFLCLLNDDIEVLTRCGGEQMVGFLESHPEVGAIAPLLLFEDGRIQHNGIVLTSTGPTHSGIFKEATFEGHYGYLRCRRETFGVSGALLFVRKAHYQAVGGFDQRYPINYNDVDFCLKLRALGLSCVVDPNVVAYHFEASSKTGTFPCEKQRFYLSWIGVSDPFFNKEFNQSNPFYERRSIGDRRPRRIDNDPESFEMWMNQEICRRSKVYQSKGQFKLTVGVPIFNQCPELLNELLTSVTMQTYENTELVVVDDASSDPKTIRWIAELERSGAATIVRHTTNRGIAGANRSLVAAMSGDFLLLVDADDYLMVDALAVMASHIEAHPGIQIFYSDEINSDIASSQFNPFFKPDFDPILLTNCCYPTHLMAIKRDLLAELNAYSDDRAAWCHDYDTLTRALAFGIKPIHVPELLYAWRIHPGSTATAGHEAKPQTIASQRFVLDRLVKELGKSHLLEIVPNQLFSHPGMWRLSLKMPVPLVDIFSARRLLTDDVEEAFRELVVAAQNVDSSGWIAVLDDMGGQEFILARLFEVALFDSAVVTVSGIITDERDQVVRWSGGFFTSEKTVLDPYIGTRLSESGYHGQLYCQRCVDVPAPINILLRKDFLLRVLLKWESVNYKSLMIALGLEAMSDGKYIAVTPHVRHVMRDSGSSFLPDDRDDLLESIHETGLFSRWYNTKLPAITSRAYKIFEQRSSHRSDIGFCGMTCGLP